MRTTQRVRLADVAELARVSLSAAGKVLNGGSDNIRVGKDARERIVQAARELNYQANMAASILAGGQSKLIGVMVDSQARYRNRAVLIELEAEAARRGYRLIISWTHDNIANMEETYQALQKHGIAGVVCLSHDYPEYKDEVVRMFSGMDNMIFLEKPFLPDRHYVSTGRTRGLHAAMKHLLKSGCRKIALTHGRLESGSESRLLAEYREALECAGLEYDPKLVSRNPGHTGEVVRRVEYTIENLIKPHRPDAVYIDDAEHAVCMQGKLQALGWKLPDELIIVGGNDDPLYQYTTPQIRSLNPEYRQIAKALLDGLLNPEKLKKPLTIEATFNL